MTNIERIKEYISKTKDIYIGSSEILFGELNKIGIEHNIDNINAILNKNNIDYNLDEWKAEWIIIASDHNNNPIIINELDNNLAIFIAYFIENKWQIISLANSLNKFKVIMIDLKEIAVNREIPDEIASNPIPVKMLNNFFLKTETNNSSLDLTYWKSFLGQNIE